MIRNVVMGRLRDATEESVGELRTALDGIRALALPGLTKSTTGLDAGLRTGGWDFAIVNDFDDAAAYVAYDHDPDHLRHRAAIVALCTDVARVQFEI